MPDQDLTRDELDVERLLYDYAWACDNGDWKLLPTLFTEDAELDYTSTDGPVGSRGEVCAWLEASLTQVGMIQHVVSNFQIDLDGDQAGGRAMFFTAYRLPDLEETLLTGGYYQLELRRTSGRWKIRRLVEDNRWMTRPAVEA